MAVPESRRAVQALAIAAVGVPCALLAHLLATGAPAPALAAVLVTGAVLLLGAAIPARSRRGLALVTAATQVAAQSVLAGVPANSPGRSPACLPAVGRAASLGLQLTVLRSDHGCPRGQFALTAGAETVVAALVAATVILVGHALAAVLTGMVLGRTLDTGAFLLRLMLALTGLLARIAALFAGSLPRPEPGPRPRRHDDSRQPLPGPARPGPATRRGPPTSVVLVS